MESEIKLFGVNEHKKLVCRGLGEDDEWTEIQSLDQEVKHLTSVEGVLFLIDDGPWNNKPGRLLARFATVDRQLTPCGIGHAHGVHGMASIGGNLYCLASYLGERAPEFQHLDWKGIGGPVPTGKVAAMTAVGEYLVVALENENTLLKRKPTDSAWSRLGSSKNAVAMAATGGDIYVVNRDNELWVRRAADSKWKMVGDSIPIRTMTASRVVSFQVSDSAELQADAAELQVAAV
jgi:hypothetical protein